MAAIPILNAVLPPLPRGAAFSYSLTFTVAANLPDPNTWTDCRLAIVPPGATPVVVSKSAFTTFSITGTGPWTLTVIIPLTAAQSLSLPEGILPFQIDFQVAAGRDDLVLGTVQVITSPYSLT